MVFGTREKPLICVFSILILLVGFASIHPEPSQEIRETEQTQQIPTTPPTINDFYVTGTNSSGNVTWSGFPGMFSFNVSDTSALNKSIFWSNNTGSWASQTNTSLSGTGPSWDNITLTFNDAACFLAFNYTVYNSNCTIYATTGLRIIKLYLYSQTAGTWNTPFQNLATAITTVEAANNWSEVENYTQTMLDQQTTNGVYVSVPTYMSSVIDSFNATSDPSDVIKYSAECNKLGITRQQAIKDALGNFTMAGSLPATGNDGGVDFNVESKWALYGFWYANNSWASANMTKWNITAAYNQFDAAVNYSVANSGGLPLWIYADGTSATSSNRYYDEDACTVDCYLIFYSLLNVSDALNKALYWWSYLNTGHWTGTHYKYTPSWDTYECEAAFFLKIISILKYYQADLENWSNVLADIGNRFLSQEWNSPQWGGVSTTYVVVHANPGNPQRRLKNTFGTWQALLGVYQQLNSTYQANMVDMLYGNNNVQPAWADLLTPDNAAFSGAGLFNASSNLFSVHNGDNPDSESTAVGEELMFMLGIVPGTTTIAFPLEELSYEYIYDIDPALLQFNSTLREICIPVVQSGTITFQYGVSPITYNFDTTGVYTVSFSPSWNMITNVTLKSSLPDNLIYFYLPLPSTPAHDVCISSIAFSEENPSVNDAVSIYATVQNKGGNTEEFSVGINCTLVNETNVGTQNITLESGQTMTLNFTWTPTAEGLLVVKAYTSQILGDASPEDNTQTAYLYVGTISGGGGCGKMPYMD